jgi:hypothetical protein
MPPDVAQARLAQLHQVQAALLGEEYVDTGRTARWPVGRLQLPGAGSDEGPSSADLFLVTHTAGAAVWEAWMTLPRQRLDAARLVSWLRSDEPASPAAVLRERVTELSRHVLSSTGVEEGFPFTILRHPEAEASLAVLLRDGAEDVVRLLYLDRSSLAFKQRVVDEELARDFCLRAGGISLISGRSALDLRVGEGMAPDPAGGTALAPRSAIPLLVSTELLLIERTVLRLFHQRLTGAAVPGSLPRLVEVKADVLDGLAEYRGTVAESNRFSAEVTSYGEEVLGLDVLYSTLLEELDALTFEITTRYQQSTNVLQFALTVVLGSFQAASVAAVIAAAVHPRQPALVLAWAVGAGLGAATAITALLRGRLR